MAVHGGPQSEWMSIAGSKVGCDLDDLYIVMHLDEFAPVGRRAASGRRRRRLERLARMCENLASSVRSHPGLRTLANLRFASETAPAGGLHSCLRVKEINRISPPQLGHRRGNSSPTRDLPHE